MSEDRDVSVKDEIVRFLGSGATLITSLESFFEGKRRRTVGDVIHSNPELFEVFARGFPEKGAKRLWVRLKRVRG